MDEILIIDLEAVNSLVLYARQGAWSAQLLKISLVEFFRTTPFWKNRNLRDCVSIDYLDLLLTYLEVDKDLLCRVIKNPT